MVGGFPACCAREVADGALAVVQDFDEAGARRSARTAKTSAGTGPCMPGGVYTRWRMWSPTLGGHGPTGLRRVTSRKNPRNPAERPTRWFSHSRLVRGRWGGESAAGGRLGNPAGQRGGLLHPGSHLRLVELVAFVDVDVARVLAPARTGRDRSQRRAAEEGHLDVVREGVGTPGTNPGPRCRTTACSTSRPCARWARSAR
jgi:hypothetical protein